MLSFLVCTVILGAAQQVPFEPVHWGPVGIPVADHLDGQNLPSARVHNGVTYVAWLDGLNGDSDIAYQRIASDGARLDGENGTRVQRPGNQSWPTATRNGIVFTESTTYYDWSVEWLRFDGTAVQLSEPNGSVTELQAVAIPGGVATFWVATDGFNRNIFAAVASRDRVARFPICEHSGLVSDVQLLRSDDLLFCSWTDYREVSRGQIYVQVVDLATGTRMLPVDGLNIAPETELAFQSELALSEPGYAALSYLEKRGNDEVVCFQIVDCLGNLRFYPAVDVSREDDDIRTHDIVAFQGGSFIAWNEDDVLRTRLLGFNGNDLAVDWAGVQWRMWIDNIHVAADDTFAWLTWTDDRHQRYTNTVAVQQFSNDNRSLWHEGGVEVTTSRKEQYRPQVFADGQACRVLWEEEAGFNRQVRLQNCQ